MRTFWVEYILRIRYSLSLAELTPLELHGSMVIVGLVKRQDVPVKLFFYVELMFKPVDFEYSRLLPTVWVNLIQSVEGCKRKAEAYRRDLSSRLPIETLSEFQPEWPSLNILYLKLYQLLPEFPDCQFALWISDLPAPTTV